MRITTSLPTTEAGLPDIEAARRLEELGYDAVGMPDLLLGDGTPGVDAVLVLTAVAASTSTIGLEFGVLSLPSRPTVWVAAQIQTLQHLSGNRVRLGVGLGGFPGSPFWRAVDAPAQGRGRVLDAALEVLPGLVAGDPTTVNDVELTLAPGAPYPPVLVGGNSEAAMRRAVRFGAAWAPSLIAPPDLAHGAARLREIAAELGRPVPSISVGGHAILSDDPAAVEGFVRNLVDFHGMAREQAASIPVTGDPAQVAERLAAYVDAGADAVGLSLDGAGFLRQAERLVEARALL